MKLSLVQIKHMYNHKIHAYKQEDKILRSSTGLAAPSSKTSDWVTFTGYVSVMPTSIQPAPLEVIKSLMVLLYFCSINPNSIEMIGFRVHFRHCFSDELAGNNQHEPRFL